jgi:hypothetical protein
VAIFKTNETYQPSYLYSLVAVFRPLIGADEVGDASNSK